MRIHLKVWRQSGPSADGKFVAYNADNVSPDMSFLEMLDVVNEGLIARGEDSIAFDSDCREGICGACGFLINGVGPIPAPPSVSSTCGGSATARQSCSSHGGRAPSHS
jgi:succinate dehydrogenase iron-sulfur subunit